MWTGLGLGLTRVFNRPEFSGRHDFQAKNLDVSVQNLEVMQ